MAAPVGPTRRPPLDVGCVGVATWLPCWVSHGLWGRWVAGVARGAPCCWVSTSSTSCLNAWISLSVVCAPCVWCVWSGDVWSCRAWGCVAHAVPGHWWPATLHVLRCALRRWKGIVCSVHLMNESIAQVYLVCLVCHAWQAGVLLRVLPEMWTMGA